LYQANDHSFRQLLHVLPLLSLRLCAGVRNERIELTKFKD